MRHTRATSEAELTAQARSRLDQMLALGTTTVEIKTGYGLDTETELKMLRVIETLDRTHAATLIPTFLGAHTTPPEYNNDAAGYTDLVINEMIPAAAAWFAQSRFAANGTPFFIDVFCEDHAFDVEQSRRILQAGLDHGMRVKIHVDQFNALGGLEMALELGAISADHLDVTAAPVIEKIAATDTIAMPLPAANFNLAHTQFANARQMIDTGCALALATDMNPGSAPAFSMPFTMQLATRYQRLLPAEALTASTINAAHAIGIGESHGSIEVGKSADLLILNTPDYRDLTYLLGINLVHKVIKAGEIVVG